MTTNALAPVTAALQASSDHWMRNRPVDAYSSLSVFECSCGEVFYPLQANEPREWPSLSAVHRALTMAIAVIPDTLVFQEFTHLEDVIPGSTFIGSDGHLHRLVAPNKWLSQNGRSSELHGLGLHLVWTPAA